MEEVLISTEVPHKILHFILFIIFFFVFEGGRCVCVCPSVLIAEGLWAICLQN